MSQIINSNPIFREEKDIYLRVKDLQIFYFKKKIINKVNFNLQKGDRMAVMGANGTGKSTLLNTLAGIHSMYKGEICFSSGGKPGYLPQRFEGDRSFPLRVEQVIAMGDPQAPVKNIHAALEEVGLMSHRSKPLAHLSVGQFQRMLFARLFLQNRSVILLDEPFASMDEKTSKDLLVCLERWAQSGKIIVVAQHNRERALKHFPITLLLGEENPQWGCTHTILNDVE